MPKRKTTRRVARRPDRRRSRRRATTMRLVGSGELGRAELAHAELLLLDAQIALLKEDWQKFQESVAQLAAPPFEPDLIDGVIAGSLGQQGCRLRSLGAVLPDVVELARRVWRTLPRGLDLVLDVLGANGPWQPGPTGLARWMRTHSACRYHALATAVAVDIWLAGISPEEASDAQAR